MFFALCKHQRKTFVEINFTFVGDKTGSRASSRQKKEREKEKEPTASRASSVAEQLLGDPERDPQKSWTLDHVAEVVYLATQVQMTEQITESLAALDSGNRDSLKVGNL